MVKETEIKLSVSPETLTALRSNPLVENRRSQAWQERNLFNCYFDTPDFALARASVALRIRQDGEQFTQTLKTSGTSMAGLSERNEWEWPLAGKQLDMAKLDETCWPQHLNAIDKQLLGNIFQTNFTRQFTELSWVCQGKQTRVEIALEQGEVQTATGSESICEVELELLEGEPSVLLVLAVELAQQLPVIPCDISKAERGYRLLQADGDALQLRKNLLTAEHSIEDAFLQLAWQLLSDSQRLLEQYQHKAQWEQLEQWIFKLSQLRALLSSTEQIVPLKNSQSLRQTLDELLETWWPFYVQGRQQKQHPHATSRFMRELEHRRWGIFSLKFALWLHSRAWQHDRTEHALRQAHIPLVHWLTRFLASELGALNLAGDMHQPERISEQQARLERILVWLEYGRHVLPATELNVLFGERCKLNN